MKIFKKQDFGNIDFGRFKGKKWSELPVDYLEYLISDECHTSDYNKTIAKQEWNQRGILDGQVELDI